MVFNKRFYVTGETIWYKIVLADTNSGTSVIHIGLLDPEGKVLVNQKLKLINGTASGSIQIPIEWPDGNYRFEAITRWNLNFGGSGIFEKIIPVYNSSISGNYKNKNYGIRTSDTLAARLTRPSSSIAVTFDKPEYGRADSVRIRISSNDGSGKLKLCVSVTDLSQLAVDSNDIFTDNSGVFSGKFSGSFKGPFTYKPEKDLLLEGIVMKPDRSAIVNSKVLSVYLSSENRFIRAGTENGRFITELPDINRKEIVQVLDLNPFQEHMPYIRPVSIWEHIDFGVKQDNSPPHTEQVDQYIYHTRLRRKLNEIFVNPLPVKYEADSISDNLPPSDKHYDMSKFKSLTDLEDFIKAVMLNVRREKDNGNTSIRLYNDQTQYYFMYHPWYLIDGLFSYDEPAILSTPFSSINTLDFYTNYQSLYQFDPLMIMNGVIRVTTKDLHWQKEILSYPNTFHFEGFMSQRSFTDEQPELNSGNNETPDLRPVVFWDPDITITHNSPADIGFRTTDNPGLFLVEISGLDSNGRIIHAAAVYKVRAR